MASPKKTIAARSNRKLKDLKPKKNPKGGALNAYLTFQSNFQGSVKSSAKPHP